MVRGKAAAVAKAPSSAATASAPAAASPEPKPAAIWRRKDDKLVEMLIVHQFPRWDILAARLLGNKTPEQAAQRYDCIVDEVTRTLHALHVDTPRAWDDAVASAEGEAPALPTADVAAAVASAGEEAEAPAAVVVEKADLASASSPAAADGAEASSGRAGRMMKGRRERKKPVAWTREEHILYLKGLVKYGPGKWKQMSREFLPTKTPSQIASHHQKHRNRLEQRKRNACKRASIHDITQPTTSAAAAVVAEPPAAAQKDELAKVGVDERPKAPAGDDERGPPVESIDGDDQLVGAAEEFPGEDDPGTLFTYVGAGEGTAYISGGGVRISREV